MERIALGLALLIALAPQAAQAQFCATDCDLVVETTTRTIEASMAHPGDVICLRAGTRGALTLRDVVGTEAMPITLQACDGTVTLQGTTGDVLALNDVRHLRVTGAGGEVPHLRIDGAAMASIGIHANGCTEHVELEHLEVFNTTYTALRVHAESASCAVREGFFVHDVHFHDVGGEGLFIGINSAVTPYRIEGVRIEDSLIERTGFQGLKVGQVGDAVLLRNVLVDVGIGGVGGEDTGLALGAGSVVRAERNVVIRPAASCVGFGGRSLTLINNVFAGCGGRGVVVNGQSDTSERRIAILHNTFVAIHDEGFTHWAPAPPTLCIVANNLFVGIAGGTSIAGIRTEGAWTLEGNLLFGDATAAGVSPRDVMTVSAAALGAAPFDLLASSPARDAAAAVSGYPVARDFLDRLRDSTPDVGAYEEGVIIVSDAGLDANFEDADTRLDASALREDVGARDAGSTAADEGPSPSPASSCAVRAGSRSNALFGWLCGALVVLSEVRRRRARVAKRASQAASRRAAISIGATASW